MGAHRGHVLVVVARAVELEPTKSLGASGIDFETWETTNPRPVLRRIRVPHPFRAFCGMGGKAQTQNSRHSMRLPRHPVPSTSLEKIEIRALACLHHMLHIQKLITALECRLRRHPHGAPPHQLNP